MPSILVVEHEGRYIERIQDALSAEGWRPRFVAGRPEALRAAASEAPNLVLVNAELPGAAELLRSFARSQGGPGSVALLGEGGGGEGLVADELLAKPFSDQDLRLVVRRRLSATEKSSSAPSPRPVAADDDHKLTSQEIFGDLLAEVEKEAASDEPESAEPTPRPAAVPMGRPVSPDEDDVERRLERTLSGVPGLSRRHRVASPATTSRDPGDPAPPRREPPTPGRDEPERQEPPPPSSPEPPRGDPEPTEPPREDPPPRRPERSLRRADDVDELLNMTLSGLALGPRGGTRRAPPADATTDSGERAGKAPSARSRTEIDFAELEALAGRARRPGRAAADRAVTGREAAEKPRGDGTPAGEVPAVAAPQAPVAAPATFEPASAPSAPDTPPAAEEAPAPDVPIPAADGASASGVPPAEAADGGEADGRRFGHYRLLERIAVGGMAEVWKARMSGVEGFQKTVAIKRILPHMNDDSDFVDMFIDEAKLAAQLNHPNITHIYDLGKIGDDYYIAMEYVDGRNLRAILNESRRKALKLPIGFALVVAARLASALDYAHRKRDFDDRDLELVHRDVSPQNVLISTDGDIKLCDFGISKAVAKLNQTETGALKGKLQYMSPEQAWGRPVDARSDLFSLGALTFEMLTGERLFTGDSEISVLEAVRECRVRRPRQVEPGVPAAVETVVLKALEREPADRYANAGEMLQALEQVLYQLRPTPSQADVATFLTRLESAAEVRPGALVPTPAPATGTSSTGTSATGTRSVDAADPARQGVTGSPGSDPDATTDDEEPGAEQASASPSPSGAPGPSDPAAKPVESLDQDSEEPTATGSRSGWEASAPPAAAGPPAGDAKVLGMAEPANAAAKPPAPAGATGKPPAASPPVAGETGRRWWHFGSAGSAAGQAPTASSRGTGSDPDATAERAGIQTDRRKATDDRRSAHRPAERKEKEITQTGAPLSAAPSAATGGGANAAPRGTAPPATPTPATEATATGTGTPSTVPAITARGEVDDDEASRGRWLLVAAILLVAVLSVAAWLWFDRPGRGATAGTPPTTDQPEAPDPAVAAPADPAVADAPPADAAAPELDLEKLVEEELARQEEEVRRKAEEDYRERARRIQAEIDALSRRQEASPPPADERSTPPTGDSPPPEPTPAPQSSVGNGPGRPAVAPDRLVSSEEDQYPAGTRGSWNERTAARSSIDRRG